MIRVVVNVPIFVPSHVIVTICAELPLVMLKEVGNGVNLATFVPDYDITYIEISIIHFVLTVKFVVGFKPNIPLMLRVNPDVGSESRSPI